jgi:hypothetical protein
MTERRFFRSALLLPVALAVIAWLFPGRLAVFFVMPILGAGIPYGVFAIAAFYLIGGYPENSVPRKILYLSPFAFFPFVAIPACILFFPNWFPNNAGDSVIISLLQFLAIIFGYTLIYGYFYVLCIWLCNRALLKATPKNA